MQRFITAVIFGSLVVILWQSSGTLSATLRPKDAIDTIQAFTGRTDLVLQEAPDASSLPGASEQTFTTADGTGIFTVDEQRQEVTTAVMPMDRAQPLGAPLNHTKALAIAQRFIHSRVRGSERLSLLTKQLNDHGAAGKAYRFEWGEHLGSQRALGLHRIAVSVDSTTGAIISYLRVLPENLTVDVEPTVSAEQARSIAEQAFGAPVIHSSTALDVWWRNNDRSQPHVLRWKVVLESTESRTDATSGDSFIAKHASYVIDAHTGEILEALSG